LVDPSDLLLLRPGGVEHLLSGANLAGVDPGEGLLPHEGIVDDLEREGRQVCLGGRDADQALVRVVRIRPDDAPLVGRRRQIVDDRVEQELDPYIPVRRGAEHGRQQGVQNTVPRRPAYFLFTGFFLGHVLLEQVLVKLGELLDKVGMSLSGPRDQFLRDLGLDPPELLEGEGLHRHQVDDPPEILPIPDGELKRHRVRVEVLLELPHTAVKARPLPVHLVHEGQTRHLVSIRLVPDGFRLGFDPAKGAEHRDHTVEHPERPLHLHGEIHVPGRIDDIDRVILPVTGNRSGCDRNSPFLFLNHEVHGGLAVMNLTEPVRDPCEIQKPLGYGRLPCVNVGRDTDIA